jgi:hypothetical protein
MTGEDACALLKVSSDHNSLSIDSMTAGRPHDGLSAVAERDSHETGTSAAQSQPPRTEHLTLIHPVTSRALRRLGWRVIIVLGVPGAAAEVERLTARLRRFLDDEAEAGRRTRCTRRCRPSGRRRPGSGRGARAGSGGRPMASR